MSTPLTCCEVMPPACDRRGVRGAVAGGHGAQPHELRWRAGDALPEMNSGVRVTAAGHDDISALVRALAGAGCRRREVCK